MDRTKWVVGSLAVFALVVLSPFLLNAVAGNLFKRVEAPHPEAVRGARCVLPEEEMRQVHMKMFMHTRDATVRSGIRIGERSLRNCQTCHPTRGDFCEQCHDFAGVKPECWDCHHYPVKSGAASPGGHHG